MGDLKQELTRSASRDDRCRRGALAALLLAAIAVAACGMVDISWKEEVLLASGQKIVVKRTAEGNKLGEIGGTGGWGSTKMTLEIVDPRLPTNPPIWSERWVPMLFDFDPETKEWFVVATFYMCEDWYALGRPKLPYLQFRAHDGTWEQVPLDPKLIGRKSNMLTGPKSGGEPALVTLDMKETRNFEAAKWYRQIVDFWPTGC
jgi:hypothetical protein